jgi:hypothetical protein
MSAFHDRHQDADGDRREHLAVERRNMHGDHAGRHQQQEPTQQHRVDPQPPASGAGGRVAAARWRRTRGPAANRPACGVRAGDQHRGRHVRPHRAAPRRVGRTEEQSHRAAAPTAGTGPGHTGGASVVHWVVRIICTWIRPPRRFPVVAHTDIVKRFQWTEIRGCHEEDAGSAQVAVQLRQHTPRQDLLPAPTGRGQDTHASHAPSPSDFPHSQRGLLAARDRSTAALTIFVRPRL